MQYLTGTVTVTNASNIVTGVGAEWLGKISPGDIFTIQNSNVWYEVATVDSDVQITLTAPYVDITAAGAAYLLHNSFTANVSLPYPISGDLQAAAITGDAIVKIDAQIQLLKDRLTALEP